MSWAGRSAAVTLGMLMLTVPSSATPTAAGGPRVDGGAVPVVRVEDIGGFVTPTTLLTRLPTVTVYRDGRVMTQGPQILIFPPPALPNVQVQRLRQADVYRLARLALAAGVGSRLDVGEPAVTDVPTTRFTVRMGRAVRMTDVYALGVGDGFQSGLTPRQRANRARLSRLIGVLRDPGDLLGRHRVGRQVPYRPRAMAVVAQPWQPPSDPVPGQRAMRWRGPRLPGPSLGGWLNLRCVTVTGAALRRVLADAARANTQTPWESAGRRWLLDFRPLLPDERDCASLRAGRGFQDRPTR
jgi:hypothetical protein